MKSNSKKQYKFALLLTLSTILLASGALLINNNKNTDRISSSGWLTTIWGDSENGTEATTQYFLTDEEENKIQLLINDSAIASSTDLLSMDRQRVTVHGVQQLSAQSNQNEIIVDTIELEGLQANNLQAATSGSQPFISIMCKFSNFSTEPKDLAFFQQMYASSYPGLDHYWREVSYDTINTIGSGAAGWFVLPHTEAYYNPTDTLGGTNLSLLAADCLAVADATVNFSIYKGINMMFNTNFDNGYAWGGSRYMTLDGVTKSWPITWEPPWGYSNITVISHEMGHAFGLPHSSGNYGATYDNQWDVMSNAWSNCGSSTHATYGCLGQHTISYHKDRLGWIPTGQKKTVNDKTYATITLEQLALPQTNNYKMAQIPINGSSSHFYTVEVRRKNGYDIKLLGQAVIIHEVLNGRSSPAHVIDIDGNGNTGDAGAMWTVGENFYDATNNIEVIINTATASGFEVTIINDAVPTPSNFRVTGSAQYSISLAWDDTAKETGYKLYRKDGASFIYLATISANTTTFTDTDVKCNATYEYKLTAYTASDESEPTNAQTGSTSSSCPPIPDNDDFDHAIDMSLGNTELKDTREATQDPDDPAITACGIGPGEGTVWYKYTPPSDSAISLDTKTTDYDTFIAVWTGTRTNLTPVICNNDTGGAKQSAVAFQVTGGVTYYIEIGKP
ncbi:MAG: hypothetical protein GY755_18660 [Chloroflexi bacterium]|nr:hypothetical protein [Chloroflexota bacterium]